MPHVHKRPRRPVNPYSMEDAWRSNRHRHLLVRVVRALIAGLRV
jgi:hypothetical protein